MNLVMHELKHHGNRPFSIGFGIVAAASIYAQLKFSDEMKANSEYYQAFHAKGGEKKH